MSEDDISRIYVIYRLFGFLFTALKSEHIWLLTEKTLIKTTVFLYKPGVTLLRKIFFLYIYKLDISCDKSISQCVC